MTSWFGFYKLADAIFGITQKMLYALYYIIKLGQIIYH